MKGFCDENLDLPLVVEPVGYPGFPVRNEGFSSGFPTKTGMILVVTGILGGG